MVQTLIVFLPLAGALLAGLLRKRVDAKALMLLTSVLVGTSALLSVGVFADVAANGPRATVEIARWFDVGAFQSTWSIRGDMLTAVMLVVVTGVSTLVHIYSIGYMEEDPDKPRFFSYLSFFTFAMLMLVTADDFIQLFLGWEGVGVASYLLIGFWYTKPSANDAAIKAFVTNRVGDFGFALGVAAVFFTFGSVKFDTIFSAITANELIQPIGAAAPVLAQEAMLSFLGYEFKALELIGFLLFIGAMGKSAQFVLHVWLPDAMEGPTPVSALIHAATMVTAGVFLVCRCSPIYEYAPAAAAFITVIGAVTALYAATVGVAQNDIKRVVAYSTCSQLGYMFFAAGVGAYGAAMFHLFTHAFFKALLFLGSGAVIHGLHHEQDMRKMGGLRGKMPWTWAMMVIGTLALTGVGIPGTSVGFAGFFSKDRIIEDAFLAGEAGFDVGMFAFWAGVIAAFLTSFYSWRLIFMTFHGAHRGPMQHFDHAHEAPWVMRGPLVLLSAGALLAGALFYAPFVGKEAGSFWRDAIYVSGGGDHGAGYHGDDAEHHDDAEHYDEAYAPVETLDHGAGLEAADAYAPESEYALEEPASAYPDEADGLADEQHADDAGHAVEAAGAHATNEAEHHGEDEHGGHGGHHVPTWVLWTPLVVTVGGFLLAYLTYGLMAGLGARIAANGGPLHAFLYKKWYFDEIYNFFLVRGARGLGDLFWKGGDKGLIDRFGPNGVASVTAAAGRATAKRQTGYLYHYAFVMLLGVAGFATLIVLSARGGAG